MRYKAARFVEWLAWILEDAAERINEDGAKDESLKQAKLLRRPLVEKYL